MMNPVPWLQMTNMISYQGLVRTFLKSKMVNLQSLFLSLKKALLQQELSIDAYIFGSVLHNNFPSDIDILIIYSIPDKLSVIKNQVFKISIEYPLDIYYMTPEEASELDFINVTKAVALASLGP